MSASFVHAAVWGPTSSISAEVFSDFRQRGFDLDAVTRAVDKQVEACAKDAADAESIGGPIVDLCTERLATAQQLRSDLTEATTNMLDGEANHARAVAQFVAAWTARASGTLDGEEAVALERNVAVAAAAERFHRANLPALYAAVRKVENDAKKMEQGAARQLQSMIDDASKIAALLFDPPPLFMQTALEHAVSVARGCGQKTTIDAYKWWPLAEARERVAFEAELKRRRSGGTRADDLPTMAELDECFARFRVAHEAEVANRERDALRTLDELRR